jgi:hypothetical protein
MPADPALAIGRHRLIVAQTIWLALVLAGLVLFVSSIVETRWAAIISMAHVTASLLLPGLRRRGRPHHRAALGQLGRALGLVHAGDVRHGGVQPGE